jgi:hypothetical protein
MDGWMDGWIDGWMDRTEKFNFLFPVSFRKLTKIIQGCCEVYFVNLSICTETAAVGTV